MTLDWAKMVIRAWKDEIACTCGARVTVYFTVADFGDTYRLLTCIHCAALFAVHPEEEFYSGIPFVALAQGQGCPSCDKALSELQDYPATYLCLQSQHIGHYKRERDTIPTELGGELEVWDPYGFRRQ